jgi:lysyl endopeptidase
MVVDHTCLDAGCYTFAINDVYGDGICCGQGNGSYTVTNPEQGTIVTGGEFTYNQSTSFCVELALGTNPLVAEALMDVRSLDAEGRFALDLPGVTGPFTLSIVDATGRSLAERASLSTINQEPVDLHDRGSGVYIAVIRSAHGSWTARLVRN